jgi:hypothetical protein
VGSAKFRHYSWVVSKEFFNSTQIYEFGASVEAAGGRWEGLMEGLLLAHLPFASNFDVEIELDRCIEMALKHYDGT